MEKTNSLIIVSLICLLGSTLFAADSQQLAAETEWTDITQTSEYLDLIGQVSWSAVLPEEQLLQYLNEARALLKDGATINSRTKPTFRNTHQRRCKSLATAFSMMAAFLGNKEEFINNTITEYKDGLQKCDLTHDVPLETLYTVNDISALTSDMVMNQSILIQDADDKSDDNPLLQTHITFANNYGLPITLGTIKKADRQIKYIFLKPFGIAMYAAFKNNKLGELFDAYSTATVKLGFNIEHLTQINEGLTISNHDRDCEGKLPEIINTLQNLCETNNIVQNLDNTSVSLPRYCLQVLTAAVSKLLLPPPAAQ